MPNPIGGSKIGSKPVASDVGIPGVPAGQFVKVPKFHVRVLHATNPNVEIISNLAHTSVEYPLVFVQPGDEARVNIGRCTIKLIPPADKTGKFAWEKSYYDKLDYYQRVEVYLISDDGARAQNDPVWTGPITKIIKSQDNYELQVEDSLFLLEQKRTTRSDPFGVDSITTTDQLFRYALKGYDKIDGDNWLGDLSNYDNPGGFALVTESGFPSLQANAGYAGPYVAAVAADGPAHWIRLNDATAPVKDQQSTDTLAEATPQDGTTTAITYQTVGGLVNPNNTPNLAVIINAGKYLSIGSFTANPQTFQTTGGTMEAWVKPNATQPNTIGTFMNMQNAWCLKVKATGRLFFGNNGASAETDTGINLSTTSWSHVVCTISSGNTNFTITVYVNGVQVFTASIAYSGGGPVGNHLQIGDDASANNPRYQGGVQDVAFYNSLLTAAQIYNHYVTGVGNIPGQSDGIIISKTSVSNPDMADMLVEAVIHLKVDSVPGGQVAGAVAAAITYTSGTSWDKGVMGQANLRYVGPSNYSVDAYIFTEKVSGSYVQRAALTNFMFTPFPEWRGTVTLIGKQLDPTHYRWRLLVGEYDTGLVWDQTVAIGSPSGRTGLRYGQAGTILSSDKMFCNKQWIVKTKKAVFQPGNISLGTRAINETFVLAKMSDLISLAIATELASYRKNCKTGLNQDTLDFSLTPGRDLSGSVIFEEGINIDKATIEPNAEKPTTALVASSSAPAPDGAGIIRWYDMKAIDKFGLLDELVQVKHATSQLALEGSADAILSLRANPGKAKSFIYVRDIDHATSSSSPTPTGLRWREGDYVWLRIPSEGFEGKVQVFQATMKSGTPIMQVVVDQYPQTLAQRILELERMKSSIEQLVSQRALTSPTFSSSPGQLYSPPGSITPSVGGFPAGGQEGDVLYFHNGAWSRLTVGSNNQVLTSNGVDPLWGSGGIPAPASPAEGDTLYYHSGVWSRLAVGSDGQILKVVSGDPAWAAGGGAGTIATGPTFTSVTDIDGLAGSPDARAGGTNDDEFDQNAAGVPTGWTAFGTPATTDTNSVKSHFHLKSTTSTVINGIYKAAPSSPFTVIAKISDSNLWELRNNQYEQIGLGVFDAVPTGNNNAAVATMYVDNTPDTWIIVQKYVNGAYSSGGNSARDLRAASSFYVKMVVTSGTNIDVYFSANGMEWYLLQSGYNPGLGTVTHVGPTMVGQAAPVPEAYYDFIRFS